MIKVRKSVFETNSSGVHSITITDKENWDLWKNGKLWFSKDRDPNFLPVKAAIEENIKRFNFNENLANAYREKKNFYNAVLKIGEGDNYDKYEDSVDWFEMYLSFEDYWDNPYIRNYENYKKEYTSKNKDKIVAFGYYGFDY